MASLEKLAGRPGGEKRNGWDGLGEQISWSLVEEGKGIGGMASLEKLAGHPGGGLHKLNSPGKSGGVIGVMARTIICAFPAKPERRPPPGCPDRHFSRAAISPYSFSHRRHDQFFLAGFILLIRFGRSSHLFLYQETS